MGDSLFNEVLGSEEIEIECPACANEFTVTLGQIGETVTCPHCSAEIQLEDESDLEEVEQAMNELEDTLDSL